MNSLKMKQVLYILLIGIFTELLFSCSIEEETGLRIEISDNYILTESDIELYDSSTCMLFLRRNISLPINDHENHSSEFSIYINNDLIYNGIFFPAYASSLSPSPIYIACYTPDSIDTYLLHFKHVDFPVNTTDERNNSRLISFYKQHQLLRNGISCTMENVELSEIDNSILNIDLMIQNNDEHPYLIPDQSKISSDQFFMLSGGFTLRDASTGDGYGQILDNSILDKSIMSQENLKFLNQMEKVTFSVTAKFRSEIEKGTYYCELYYGNIIYLQWIDLELNQSSGRVWVGEDYTKKDFEIEY